MGAVYKKMKTKTNKMKHLKNALLVLVIMSVIEGQTNKLAAQISNVVEKENVEDGIKWTTGLTWEQVQQKAKAENKYIFLDCFTTWCGPCKMMDASVFGNDAVGDYFNRRFVSVKVQMDKTKKDNEEVQGWYIDVAAINEQYHVNAYPTYVFLSPRGTIVDKQIGFKEVKDFIALGQNAIVPGKVYEDPYAEYSHFIVEYKNGKRDYDRYPEMIIVADKLHENDFSNRLMKELSDYVSTLSRKDRYTKEKIEMWNRFTFSSNSQVFRFFYQDGKLIDKVMDKKGYSDKFIDKTIQSEVVAPFFDEQNKSKSVAMSGPYLSNATGRSLVQFDSSEADWTKIEKEIKKRFNTECARRNVLTARMEWYKRHGNWLPYLKFTLEYLNRYWSLKYDGPWGINSYAWEAFLYTTDKKIINEYIKWMKRSVESNTSSAVFDTYANLLYKAGRTKDAIEWETKAMNLVDGKGKKLYKQVVEQMQKGESTYGVVRISN
jgi:thioredoxin-related protein